MRYTLLLLVAVTFVSCRNSNPNLNVLLSGKWYGQRQTIGNTYEEARNKMLREIKENRPNFESVNFIFQNNGTLKMEDKGGDINSPLNQSAAFSISPDSILTCGRYKTKIKLLTKDSLILYAEHEDLLKSLRIFTRKPQTK